MAISVAVRPNDRLIVAKLAQMFLGEAAVDDHARFAVALREHFAVGRQVCQ